MDGFIGENVVWESIKAQAKKIDSTYALNVLPMGIVYVRSSHYFLHKLPLYISMVSGRFNENKAEFMVLLVNTF